VTDALFLVLLVVLVNVGCILSFDRAQRALRDLGAAWVRALSSPSVRHETTEPAPPDDEPGEPAPRPIELGAQTAPVAAPVV
jgi:hypothetical protein